jgi:hypothetical protein
LAPQASAPGSGTHLGERDLLTRIAGDLGDSASKASTLKKIAGVITSVAFAYVYVAHRDHGDTSVDEGAIDALARDSVLSVHLTPRSVTGVDVAATPWLDLWVDNDQKGLQVFH